MPLLEVKLKDASPSAFRMVLNYVYTDCMDPAKKSIKIKLKWSCFLSFHHILVLDPQSSEIVVLMMDVYRLADKVINLYANSNEDLLI
jgi:leucine-zipper-like transcriptional regulator 1